MNPFFALTPLSANIKHSESDFLYHELCLNNASSWNSEHQNVLGCGQIVGRTDSVKVRHEAENFNYFFY